MRPDEDEQWEQGSTRAIPDDTRTTLRLRGLALEVADGPDKGRTMHVDRPMTFIVGSGPTADLQLTDETVSREHLRLTLQPEGVLLRDEGSRNGTWVSGLRVRDVTFTVPSAVTLGATRLVLTPDAGIIDLPLSAGFTFGGAFGVSAAMRHVFAVLESAARSEVTVLLEGESGVGKEVLAQGIHAQSTRAEGPFVALDCGAIPSSLIESELFGHERGAFTGAERARVGAFEQANHGTLFLDEIGELPLEMQPKLLRVLESRQVRPLGAQAVRSLDVRIVAATNRNLSEAANRKMFRSDLFYRLAVARVSVPPLRDRREDIVPLALKFLRRLPGFTDAELSPELNAMLEGYAWPGNVRELRNVVERYAVLGPNPAALFERAIVTAPVEDLAQLPYHEARRIVVDRFERSYLPTVLANAGNVVARAARTAQLGRASFHRMLRRVRQSPDRDEDSG